MMRCHLFIYNNLEAIEIAKKLGIDLELDFDTGKLGVKRAELTKIKEASNGIAKSIHGPFMDLNPGAIDYEVRKITHARIKWAIEIARQLEIGDLVVHDGYIPLIYGYSYLKARWLRTANEFFRDVSKLSADAGVRVLVENMFTDDPLIIKELIDGTDLNTCLDVAHLSFSSNFSAAEWVDALTPFIKEVHIHDNNGRTDEHLPLGKGNVDFSAVAAFSSMFTLEVYHEADIIASVEYLREKGWI
ncbi:MAG: sugar phosphate isomerase/epimerase [Nitrososphaerota archaeon]|jgi:sugar phosphate isomerase/epimerase|nr:sugar phosphate isomerase/epimerase [Nitrososphaerota archaeon]MDG7045745.1 sugar phosphate isomerase/epimerase [Nitrososphaerota archaeon]MDG7048470.1 sugar phosphate isomerase/epimerase [Nitrososphaerota archaeon]